MADITKAVLYATIIITWLKSKVGSSVTKINFEIEVDLTYKTVQTIFKSVNPLFLYECLTTCIFVQKHKGEMNSRLA